jgi:hypothetical protein
MELLQFFGLIQFISQMIGYKFPSLFLQYLLTGSSAFDHAIRDALQVIVIAETLYEVIFVFEDGNAVVGGFT